ncbi:MAG: hypothetical protein PHI19_02555 [Clostridia bacterium]|nr:hypothetical protein [Clostridia bacterium]
MDGARKRTIKSLVLIGLLAASITAGKLALMQLPNVEIVTLFIIMYTAVFGYKISLPATVIFVTIEMLLFGINTWVVSYYIHWCALALITVVIVKFFKMSRVALTVEAVVMTACFGILTTLVDTIFASSLAQIQFFQYFAALYARGIVYFAIHIVSNAAIVCAFSEPLSKLLFKLKTQYFTAEGKIV